MTKKQKYEAIIERLRNKGIEFPKVEDNKKSSDEHYLSFMVILGYIRDMSDKGILNCEIVLADKGKDVSSICQEFDWKPSDNDIIGFVTEMIEEVDRKTIAYLIEQYRDNKEEFLKIIKKNIDE